MKSEFELIKHKLDRDVESINIYPFSDSHIGSPDMDMKKLLSWRNAVLEDKNGYVVIAGDIFDNALKNSKSNSYEALMRPREAKEAVYEYLKPLKDRILGITNGNHEWRSLLVGDDCPLYDVACRLNLEDLYRENMAFIKISLGSRKKDRQYSYNLCVAHGAAKAKSDVFAYSLDNCDVFIHGHTHAPTNEFPKKLVIDSYNECVREVSMIDVTCPALLNGGGYGLRGMYRPKANDRYPVIKLYGNRKGSELIWKEIV